MSLFIASLVDAGRVMDSGLVGCAGATVLSVPSATVGVAGVVGVDVVVADFAPHRWYVTLFYAIAVVAVGFHVRHGLWSGLQTLGRSSAAAQNTLKGVALVVAVALTVGFLSVPFAVLTGLVR